MSSRQITAKSPSSTPLHIDRSSSTYRFLPKWRPLATPSFRASFKSDTFSSTFLSRRVGYREWHPPKKFQVPSTSPIFELHPSQLSLAFALLSCVNPSSI